MCLSGCEDEEKIKKYVDVVASIKEREKEERALEQIQSKNKN